MNRHTWMVWGTEAPGCLCGFWNRSCRRTLDAAFCAIRFLVLKMWEGKGGKVTMVMMMMMMMMMMMTTTWYDMTWHDVILYVMMGHSNTCSSMIRCMMTCVDDYIYYHPYIYIILISYECSALVAASASSCHRTSHDMFLVINYDYCHADIIIRWSWSCW